MGNFVNWTRLKHSSLFVPSNNLLCRCHSLCRVNSRNSIPYNSCDWHLNIEFGKLLIHLKSNFDTHKPSEYVERWLRGIWLQVYYYYNKYLHNLMGNFEPRGKWNRASGEREHEQQKSQTQKRMYDEFSSTYVRSSTKSSLYISDQFSSV